MIGNEKLLIQRQLEIKEMEANKKEYFDLYQLKNFPHLKSPEEFATKKILFSFTNDKLKSGFLSFAEEIPTCLT
jgi:hypothetical protein